MNRHIHRTTKSINTYDFLFRTYRELASSLYPESPLCNVFHYDAMHYQDIRNALRAKKSHLQRAHDLRANNYSGSTYTPHTVYQWLTLPTMDSETFALLRRIYRNSLPAITVRSFRDTSTPTPCHPSLLLQPKEHSDAHP
jgi:hypothetical protein